MVSLATTVPGGAYVAAQVDFPDAPGPTRTTRHGDGSVVASAVTPQPWRDLPVVVALVTVDGDHHDNHGEITAGLRGS
jgi:hypothetical protein